MRAPAAVDLRTTPEVDLAASVTILFVPGNRPERFAKACAMDAGAVIIDLEDAVAPGDKAQARRHAVAALSAAAEGRLRALVRVNTPGSDWFAEDLAALGELARTPDHGLRGIMLPKAEHPSHIAMVTAAVAEGTGVVPLVETALGVVNALDLARTPGVARLAFGAVDYALDIGATDDPRALDYARGVLVVASRAAGIAAPLDSPSTAIEDLARVATEAGLARMLGFGGKLCIHPAQLAAVGAAFAPTRAATAWAAEVLAVANHGAAQVNGEMIDRPVVERARRIAATAAATRARKDQS
ncbi:CoA ester lyase [Arthrobacter sp. SDTb3-6]|uniref:HpcH/HpaI aldolase/citrate lyase family protein n=1 Tax=Arthrobacter sp. SDTb3-6 TaxID=2713571 RepID=UPI00159E445A|nr:CoA ester lyase [Arthrobacter sp. SDTb3-6]NVN00059.1 CoA ester lyase [Arthrobacter sp. SDTb3-6]